MCIHNRMHAFETINIYYQGQNSSSLPCSPPLYNEISIVGLNQNISHAAATHVLCFSQGLMGFFMSVTTISITSAWQTSLYKINVHHSDDIVVQAWSWETDFESYRGCNPQQSISQHVLSILFRWKWLCSRQWKHNHHFTGSQSAMLVCTYHTRQCSGRCRELHHYFGPSAFSQLWSTGSKPHSKRDNKGW